MMSDATALTPPGGELDASYEPAYAHRTDGP